MFPFGLFHLIHDTEPSNWLDQGRRFQQMPCASEYIFSMVDVEGSGKGGGFKIRALAESGTITEVIFAFENFGAYASRYAQKSFPVLSDEAPGSPHQPPANQMPDEESCPPNHQTACCHVRSPPSCKYHLNLYSTIEPGSPEI